jgi:hypothetical protein
VPQDLVLNEKKLEESLKKVSVLFLTLGACLGASGMKGIEGARMKKITICHYLEVCGKIFALHYPWCLRS